MLTSNFFRFVLGPALLLMLLPAVASAGIDPGPIVPEPSSIIVWLGIFGVGAMSYRRTRGRQDD